jgi:hypothetical protein
VRRPLVQRPHAARTFPVLLFPWLGLAPFGCVYPSHSFGQRLGTVSVPASPKAVPAVVLEKPLSRFRFDSVEQACERENGPPEDEAEGEWLVEAVCFHPEAFGSSTRNEGVWMIYPFAHGGEEEDGSSVLTTDWAVIWVWPDGQTAEGPVFHSSRDVSFENQSNSPEVGILSHLFDYDGDGRDELFLPVRQLQHSSEGPRRLWLFTVNAMGEVAPYPTVDGEVVWTMDVEGDGRPDLLFDPDGTYTEDSYPVHTSIASGGWRLAHSLPDGTFSTTDDLAQTYVSE